MPSKGKRVGRYELTKTIGKGAFSTVKLAIDDKGNQYAVKVIDKQQIIAENMEKQLMTEISVLKLLTHPYIVRLIDVLQTTNNIYVVLELVTGGELFDRIITAKHFDEDVARRYFQQLISALHFFHNLGVSHRDLKPENLLIDENGDLKITDFGLASLNTESKGNLLRTVCGTPNYVAPEVIKEKGYIGSVADVWSAGIILFVMLAGYPPFDDTNINILFKKIECGEYITPKHFSSGAKDLVNKILVVDPAKRPSTSAIIAHPWLQKNWNDRITPNLEGLKPRTTARPTVTETAGRPTSTNTYGRTEIEKETENLDSKGPVELGAFELIQNLAMTKLNDMTTNRPVIKIFTRFIVGVDMKTAERMIVDLLTKIEANPRKKEGGIIKGFKNLPKGLLNFSVTCVALVDSKMTMIEVRRGRGDTFDFHDIYRKIKQMLGKTVISKETSNSDT